MITSEFIVDEMSVTKIAKTVFDYQRFGIDKVLFTLNQDVLTKKIFDTHFYMQFHEELIKISMFRFPVRIQVEGLDSIERQLSEKIKEPFV